MDKFFWTGYYYSDRISGISELETIIDIHGFITDFKEFSDISISFTIEIEEQKINALYTDLKGHLRLDDFDFLNSNSFNERIIFLNVTFLKGTGDLLIEMPAVPG